MCKLKQSALFLMVLVIHLKPTASTHCKDGTDEYCAACLPETSNSSGCGTCIVSFSKNPENICAEPTTKTENCLTYNEDPLECTACIPPYYLTEEKKCETVKLDGCLAPKSKTTCMHCSGHLLKDDETCDTTKTCAVEGCSTCKMVESSEVCVACKSAFVYKKTKDDDTSGTCEPLVSKWDGCMMIVESKCVLCGFGYYVNSKLGDDFTCKRSTAYSGVDVWKAFSIAGLLVLLTIN